MSRSPMTRRLAPASIIFSGWQGLERLRHLLASAYQAGGVSVVFDPSSDARLRDYVGIGVARAIDHAALGTLVGGIIGAVFGNARIGMTVGGVIGGAAGGILGARAIREGWRVRVAWAADGTPFAQLHRLEDGP